jgi:hypothetical protein
MKEDNVNHWWRVVVSVSVLGGVACGGSLSEAGAQVKLMKADPPQGCAEVGGVSGYKVGPNYQERLKNDLRNDAAAKGANYVRLETLTSDGNASGTAFRCPEAPSVTSAPVSPHP